MAKGSGTSLIGLGGVGTGGSLFGGVATGIVGISINLLGLSYDVSFLA